MNRYLNVSFKMHLNMHLTMRLSMYLNRPSSIHMNLHSNTYLDMYPRMYLNMYLCGGQRFVSAFEYIVCFVLENVFELVFECVHGFVLKCAF